MNGVNGKVYQNFRLVLKRWTWAVWCTWTPKHHTKSHFLNISLNISKPWVFTITSPKLPILLWRLYTRLWNTGFKVSLSFSRKNIPEVRSQLMLGLACSRHSSSSTRCWMRLRPVFHTKLGKILISLCSSLCGQGLSLNKAWTTVLQIFRKKIEILLHAI